MKRLERNFRILFFIVIVVFFLWIFTAEVRADENCDQGHDAGKPFHIESEVSNVLVTMFWYDDIWNLREAVNDPDVCGFSECEVHEEQNIAYCHIHAVRPKVIDDIWSATLGHEVLHGLWGQFHLEYIESE